jgi:hypothetical protein
VRVFLSSPLFYSLPLETQQNRPYKSKFRSTFTKSLKFNCGIFPPLLISSLFYLPLALLCSSGWGGKTELVRQWGVSGWFSNKSAVTTGMTDCVLILYSTPLSSHSIYFLAHTFRGNIMKTACSPLHTVSCGVSHASVYFDNYRTYKELRRDGFSQTSAQWQKWLRHVSYSPWFTRNFETEKILWRVMPLRTPFRLLIGFITISDVQSFITLLLLYTNTRQTLK